MLGILAAAQAPERPHEGRLQNIVSIHSGTQHPNREPRARVLMAPYQAGKRFDVAAEDSSDQFRVRRARHKSMTPGMANSVTTKGGNGSPPFPPRLRYMGKFWLQGSLPDE